MDGALVLSHGGSEARAVAALTRVRVMLGIVAAGLFLSGMTCYFLPWELRTVIDVVWGRGEGAGAFMPQMHAFILKMEQAVLMVRSDYPELFLGTDYLGFAHALLAILFIGAIRDPARNIWVIQFGIIASVLVVPAAFLFGSLRGAPWLHYLVDSSFGAGAVIFLYAAYRGARSLEKVEGAD
ncbi:MAG TPA: hypothetical protein VM658_05020 [bacterium]|nr:hypothetical protein [bacterium]